MSSDPYAKLFFSIWRDRDFRSLSPDAQYMYLMVLSSPHRSHIGRVPWAPGQLAANSNDESLTPERVTRALNELHARRYVLIDESTQEMLIRALVRRDDFVRIPNFGATIARNVNDLVSHVLYREMVEELARIYADLPPDVLRAEKQPKKVKPGPKPAALQKLSVTFWEKLEKADADLYQRVVYQAQKDAGRLSDDESAPPSDHQPVSPLDDHLEPYFHYDPETGELFDQLIPQDHQESNGQPVDRPVHEPVDNTPPY